MAARPVTGRAEGQGADWGGLDVPPPASDDADDADDADDDEAPKSKKKR